MNRLSVAIIARNEELKIGRTLRSVSWADEIILVDCESSDDTVKIAADLGAKIHTEPNRSNLNINKNIAIGKCTGDWILILDADEVIPDDLAGEIRREINEPVAAGYRIPRRNIIFGKWLKYGGQYPDYQLRLFQSGKARFPAIHVHERIGVDGIIQTLMHPMDHYPYSTLKEMMRKGMFYIDFEAAYLQSKNVPVTTASILNNGGIKPLFRMLRRYVLKRGYLDGPQGLAVAVFDFWNQSLRWLRLWELNRDEKDTK